MNKLALRLVPAFLLASSVSASTFSISGAGGSIPDPGGVPAWNTAYPGTRFESSVVLPCSVVNITKVTLGGLQHDERGDLRIALRNPAGTVFNLVTRPGFSGAGSGDSGDYLLGDFAVIDFGGAALNQGATDLPGGTYNRYTNSGTGQYTFSGALNFALASISGGTGTWTLIIEDWEHGDVGALSYWTLEGNNSGCGGVPVAVCDPGIAGVMACPCFNPPTGTVRGCNNSASTGGAYLGSTGTTSLANDTLVFHSGNQTSSAFGIVLQGDTFNGAGVGFGQGVRCVGGALKRLYVASTFGTGGVNVPAGTDPTVSSRSASLGDTILAGQHRYYMVYYRDPIVLGGCPANLTLNGTNALDATWN